MSEQTLEQLFRTQMASYANCDVNGLLDSFTDDCVLTDMADTANPFVGKAAVRRFLVEYFSTMREVDVVVTHVAVGDNLVIGELNVTADYVGHPFSEQDSRTVRLRYCVAEEFRDGQVANERFYWDTREFKCQLVLPE